MVYLNLFLSVESLTISFSYMRWKLYQIQILFRKNGAILYLHGQTALSVSSRETAKQATTFLVLEQRKLSYRANASCHGTVYAAYIVK